MRVEVEAFRRSVAQVLNAGGVDQAQTRTVGANLVWCDMVGRRNHGIERLPILLDRVAKGGIASPCHPRFVWLAPNRSARRAASGARHESFCFRRPAPQRPSIADRYVYRGGRRLDDP